MQILPITQQFWVDLYIGPARPPTGINQTWQTQGGQGLAWGVTSTALPIPAGATRTLTIGDSYYRGDLSNFGGSVPAGTPLYAQVDSANLATSYGAVLEAHEARGGAYNNIYGPQAAASLSLAQTSGGTQPIQGQLPQRWQGTQVGWAQR